MSHDAPAQRPTVGESPAESATSRPADLGVIDLGVMGENLALNIADHGYSVALWTHTEGKVQRFIENGGAGRRWIGTQTLKGWPGRTRGEVMITVPIAESLAAGTGSWRRALDPEAPGRRRR